MSGVTMRQSGPICAIGAAALVLFSVPGWAQSPASKGAPQQSSSTESVIVTAPAIPPEAAVESFVKFFAASPPPIGKIARWRSEICPVTVGLPSDYDTFITQRVKSIATRVGAPVGEASCKANVDIVFTPAPQAFMDSVREKRAVLLGYHDTAQAQQVATVTHAIQAWYTTETADYDGTTSIDSAQGNRGVDVFLPPGSPACRTTGCWLHLPEAREEHVAASRLTDTLRSELFHVIVVVDMNRIAGIRLGALADYIAMLALVPTQEFDTCLELLSIANLMAPACDKSKTSDGATAFDLAYLRAVYRMDTSASLAEQRSAIGYKMMQELSSR
jgi:hypothetical protein